MDSIAAGVLIGKSDPFPRLGLPPDFGVGLWKPIAYDVYEKILMGGGRRRERVDALYAPVYHVIGRTCLVACRVGRGFTLLTLFCPESEDEDLVKWLPSPLEIGLGIPALFDWARSDSWLRR